MTPESHLRRRSGETIWHQIAERLAAEIAAGAPGSGERLPTEAALATRFRVNRHTVRRALADLEARGLVRVEQGRGSFVAETMVDCPLGMRTRFSENLLGRRRTPARRLLRETTLPASAEIAKALALAPGTTVVALELIGEADGRPISIATHYFPAARFAGIGAVVAELGSITEALRRFSIHDYTRRITRITAHLPDPADAAQLRQSASRPVLRTESVNVDAAGRPLEYGIARFAGDRVQLVVGAEN
ncbi:MAG: phosphonate metabolism transcriptional regulator PhnF [Alphaproteobacteria bacterium]|nr:phosphonate metabolism transcriptional regulator PhnF [Alphaproteobacteria bacterium]